MVEENILFCYMLTDAWGLRLAKVTVFKDGKVQYKDGKRKRAVANLMSHLSNKSKKYSNNTL